MSRTILILLCALVCLAYGQNDKLTCEHPHKGGSTRFPRDFKFGVATAAYQIEGGWDADGKGPSIWDTYTHDHSYMIEDRSSGDVAADSYNMFDKDLLALIELGVSYYRFSISWPRVLPEGHHWNVNQKGIDYYNMVIDKLLAHNIEPMVTMYHYDLPEAISKFGGFNSPLFLEYFYQYANLLFERYGDRVKSWITFNEPFDYCIPGYGYSEYPPMYYGPGRSDYMCGDYTLKAHGLVYRLYREKYYPTQGGKVGITLSSQFYIDRYGTNPDATDRAMHFNLGWFANALFGWKGNYPDVMLHDIAINSIREGRPFTRLQPFDEEWTAILKGAADFLGINYYSSSYVERKPTQNIPVPSWLADTDVTLSKDPNWKQAKSVWLHCVPEGLEQLLKWIQKTYNNIEVYITENGWSDGGELSDDGRIDYMKAHLQAVLNAINDGANVTRFTQWSLVDNFEWRKGYTEKFGLYYVDFQSQRKDRIAKKSSRYYAEVIKQRVIPNDL
jgi:beta-glucosidase/6-phospho-beta-glucosidase/beta-galactosidase